MANVRSISYTIRVVTDKGLVIKVGGSFDKLEDDLWALYDAGLSPFCPDPGDEEDDDDPDETGHDLDDEFESLTPPETPADFSPPEG